MKRSVIAILAATGLSLATAAYAFGPSGHGHHGKHGDFFGGQRGMHGFMFERMLDLTNEQKTAVDDIYSAAKEQRKESVTERGNARQAMMDLNPSDADYQTKVVEFAKQKAAQVEQRIIAHAATQAQVYEILTPEQREQLEQLKTEAKERFAKRRQRADGDSE
ncbi:MAG: Spy/CpxP family protein refolding chaperone [Pseudomonadales bacterium]